MVYTIGEMKIYRRSSFSCSVSVCLVKKMNDKMEFGGFGGRMRKSVELEERKWWSWWKNNGK